MWKNTPLTSPGMPQDLTGGNGRLVLACSPIRASRFNPLEYRHKEATQMVPVVQSESQGQLTLTLCLNQSDHVLSTAARKHLKCTNVFKTPLLVLGHFERDKHSDPSGLSACMQS